MNFSYSQVLEFKRILDEKFGVYLHFHDACGGQYFSFDEAEKDDVCWTNIMTKWHIALPGLKKMLRSLKQQLSIPMFITNMLAAGISGRISGKHAFFISGIGQRGNDAVGCEPVSYTHLDVYKRQALNIENQQFKEVVSTFTSVNVKVGFQMCIRDSLTVIPGKVKTIKL